MSEVTIDKYSHYFKVSGHGPETISILNSFCVHLTHFTSQKKHNGRYERVQGKVFATRNKDKTEYRFPITVLDHFIPYVEGKGFYKFNVVRIVEHDMYTPEPIDIQLNPIIKPRDYQIPIIDFTTLEDKFALTKIPKYRRVLPIQMGKEKPLSR